VSAIEGAIACARLAMLELAAKSVLIVSATAHFLNELLEVIITLSFIIICENPQSGYKGK
ncbi:hypothetical protein KKI34_05430, partial [Pseudoalteromonas tetraodonis]